MTLESKLFMLPQVVGACSCIHMRVYLCERVCLRVCVKAITYMHACLLMCWWFPEDCLTSRYRLVFTLGSLLRYWLCFQLDIPVGLLAPPGDSARRLKKYLAVFYTLCTKCSWWEKQQNELFEPPAFYKDGQNHGDVSLLVCLREASGLVSRSAGWSLDVWVVRVVSSDWSVSVSYTHHFMAIFT